MSVGAMCGEKVEEPTNNSPMSDADLVASQVAGALQRLVPEVAAEPHLGGVEVFVPTEQLEAAARVLRDDLGFDYLSMVTAVDWPDDLEVVYLVYSLTQHPSVGVYLKTRVPRDPVSDCPTLTTIWPGADFQERETYDLMGINFVGHPDMTRILTEDNFPGHPLRKDFTIEPDYVLMRHLRYGAEGQLAPPDEQDQTRGTSTDHR
jgi:NADH:ubiquinone oxidoreductase subunit C